MKVSAANLLKHWIVAALCLCVALPAVPAEPVQVHHSEGTVHGFLALRNKAGRLLAVGDLTQSVHGDRVTSHLNYRFKDGSIDEETAVFSQRENFQLVSDHHVQKGPSFPHPIDLTIDVQSGQVTVRSSGKDGKEEVNNEHLDLPPDLANGIVLTIVKNIPRETHEIKLPLLVATPKPRIVQLVISAQDEDPFSLAGSNRKAMRYEIKFELGGLAGVVAPLIGKQPPPISIWISGGEAPAFVKEEGFSYEGGPIWVAELTSPVWPRSTKSHTKK